MLNYTCNCARQKRFEMVKYLILIAVLLVIFWITVAFWWAMWMLFDIYGVIAVAVLTIGTMIYIRYSDVEGNV